MKYSVVVQSTRLTIVCVLFSAMNLSSVLSRSWEKTVWMLKEIALNILIAFGRVAIFIMLILPIQEHLSIFLYFLQFLSLKT